MARALHLNCASGISGDMLVGALLDLGADLERMRSAVASLGLGGVGLSREEVRRGGLAAVSFGVDIPPDSRRLRAAPVIPAVLPCVRGRTDGRPGPARV